MMAKRQWVESGREVLEFLRRELLREPLTRKWEAHLIQQVQCRWGLSEESASGFVSMVRKEMQAVQ